MGEDFESEWKAGRGEEREKREGERTGGGVEKDEVNDMRERKESEKKRRGRREEE